MATPPLAGLTIEQYLEIERSAGIRSEYRDGAMYAMAGGSRNHAVIAMETGARLSEQLRGRDCTVAGRDLHVFCTPARILTYPDLVVFCEPARLLPGSQDTLTDATLIVEVLSPSTQNYDRGEKFR